MLVESNFQGEDCWEKGEKDGVMEINGAWRQGQRSGAHEEADSTVGTWPASYSSGTENPPPVFPFRGQERACSSGSLTHLCWWVSLLS